jgi:hypothetical protein
MIIGWSSRSVDEKTSKPFHVEQSEPAFEPLATYLISIFGFAMTAEVYNRGGIRAVPWAPDDVAIFDGAACNTRLVWQPNWFVHCTTLNGWPPTIDFSEFEAEPVPPSTKLPLGVLEHYIFGLSQFLLTNFYENQKHLIKDRYGSVKRWPPHWSFARIVRNAMSHGGKIRIDDNIKVQWRNLTYSDASNGRPIINTDIWPGDVFILVRDMQTELKLL